MPSMKLTKSNIDKLQFTGKRVDYFDTEMRGFCLRVGAESKSFFARKEIRGKPIRKTIGKLGVWTPATAREEARRLLQQMAQGIDPREEERRRKEASVTLKEVFTDYLKHRGLKETTRRNYEFVRDLYLAPWADRPLVSITRADVLQLHRKITAEVGAATANMAMVTFRALWNYAHLHLETPPASPTKVLTAAKAWAPNRRRTDRLLPVQFPQFIEALRFLRHSLHDAYLLVLHTGMRSEEVAGLLWAHVDLDAGMFSALNTKNGSDLTLPMSRTIRAMFERRRALQDGSPFVFKGQGRGGNVKLQAAHLQNLGFQGLTVHGLRRTFRYLCETLNFPPATVKRLMNHSLKADITDSYLELEIEELRPYVERISAEIARLSGSG